MSQDDETDDVLLARLVRSGDARAFDTLYRRHSALLYATAVRVMRGADGAADVVHDAWIRAVENGRSFERRSTFRTWVTGILLNVIREHVRDVRRNGVQSDGDPAPPAGVASDVTWADARFAVTPTLDVSGVDPVDLEAAIAALPAGFRHVLVLHDVEGFTHEEIAEMLDIVPGTSKSQLARARQRVREMLVAGVPRRMT